MTIKVLIVDDSALVRKILSEIFGKDREIQVVGTAVDPYAARERIKQLNPDVITLDVEMPRMDGITFLENLMRLRPMPVVMVSSLTQRGAEVTLRALELGAVDFVAKPRIDIAGSLADYADELIEKVKAAARARVRAPAAAPPAAGLQQPGIGVEAGLGASAAACSVLRTTDRIVAVGASTGGTEAIRELLAALPADAAAMVISQHIPAAFSRPFAERMNRCSAMSVCEAQNGQYILPGHVYIAPGDRHLLVERDGARYRCFLSGAEPVNRHRPSVDVLFRSLARNVGPNATGVILTGMGDDGARGLKEMLEAGACTIAQDEASSVVWGMPGAAVRLGAAQQVLPLQQIAAELLRKHTTHQAMQLARTAT
ncbi:two-component system, chemotaxis family, response regulator CheB [Steroidobacter denitrificans]|uniref:Protein-glutamate methylesterase/protein-glutamine glutaminase n=1 Tax=Steroidobacter denitrificans TaxID=465721 RepID=A0A127FAL4_STEDE|nr:chemotaxis response regulator protein-glutamate methylesterase [Steroidobacter denitrificans]AMN46630.1 two-component system, chemotaxis family, response regulator CheB [Steroidobacter denitrificans]